MIDWKNAVLNKPKNNDITRINMNFVFVNINAKFFRAKNDIVYEKLGFKFWIRWIFRRNCIITGVLFLMFFKQISTITYLLVMCLSVFIFWIVIKTVIFNGDFAKGLLLKRFYIMHWNTTFNIKIFWLEFTVCKQEVVCGNIMKFFKIISYPTMENIIEKNLTKDKNIVTTESLKTGIFLKIFLAMNYFVPHIRLAISFF